MSSREKDKGKKIRASRALGEGSGRNKRRPPEGHLELPLRGRAACFPHRFGGNYNDYPLFNRLLMDILKNLNHQKLFQVLNYLRCVDLN